MTGLMKRILRRREPGRPPRRGVASLIRGRSPRGQRLPGYRRVGPFKLPGFLKRWPWSSAQEPAAGATQETGRIVAEPPPPSFKERGRLRRRLRFLRRARELGFRDIGGLIFDMRRFERNRPDLLDAKLDALLAVDEELRALERLLDDRRPFHELREPGISSCARCGALHSSEANFCPHCGLQFAGPRAMGEVGGAIAAPPQPPPAPGEAAAPAAPAAPAQQEWPWPSPQPAADQPTAPTIPEPAAEQLTVAHVPVLQRDPPEAEPPSESLRTPAAGGADEALAEPAAAADSSPPPPAAKKPATRKPAARKTTTRKPAAKRTAAAKPADSREDGIPTEEQQAGPAEEPPASAADEQGTETHLPPRASGGS